MTKLLAQVLDFHLVRGSDGNDMAYHFRIGSCEDFAETMEAFKGAIPLAERIPLPDRDWFWQVAASPRNFAALDRIFDNWASCYDMAKSQLTLWKKA